MAETIQSFTSHTHILWVPFTKNEKNFHSLKVVLLVLKVFRSVPSGETKSWNSPLTQILGFKVWRFTGWGVPTETLWLLLPPCTLTAQSHYASLLAPVPPTSARHLTTIKTLSQTWTQHKDTYVCVKTSGFRAVRLSEPHTHTQRCRSGTICRMTENTSVGRQAFLHLASGVCVCVCSVKADVVVQMVFSCVCEWLLDASGGSWQNLKNKVRVCVFLSLCEDTLNTSSNRKWTSKSTSLLRQWGSVFAFLFVCLFVS